jgi:hypothetical protein
VQKSQEKQIYEPYVVAQKEPDSRSVPNQISRPSEQLCNCQRKNDRDHSDYKFEETQTLPRSLRYAKSRSHISISEGVI